MNPNLGAAMTSDRNVNDVVEYIRLSLPEEYVWVFIAGPPKQRPEMVTNLSMSNAADIFDQLAKDLE